ncbi:MAG: hypothetical protein ACJATL_000878 [Rickettsiales bacterium]|jgi:hypothetical protein
MFITARFLRGRVFKVLQIQHLEPSPIFSRIFRKNIFEDKIEDKNRPHLDVRKVFLFDFSSEILLKKNAHKS